LCEFKRVQQCALSNTQRMAQDRTSRTFERYDCLCIQD
jgi:hypothetical protein